MTGRPYARTIPRGIYAATKLSPETLSELQDFYASYALVVSTDKGRFDPAKQRAQWIKATLKESPEIAEYCISRLIWHHYNETVKLDNQQDFRHIVGLMQFDNVSAPWLSRDQEVALLRVSRSVYSVKGNSGFTRNYGDDIIGTWMLYESIGKYTLENHGQAGAIAALIRERGLMEGTEIGSILAGSNHTSLTGGAL